MTLSNARPIRKFSEEWWANYAHPDNRCVAHRKNGNQCLRPARLGATVCRFHGGNAPQVIAKARERIELAADRMARELLGIATTADSEAVKLAAVKDALDRAGLSPKQAVDVAVELKPWEELLRDAVFDMRSTREEAAARRGLTQPKPEIVDAEVVPDTADLGASAHARQRERDEQGDYPPSSAGKRTAPPSAQLDTAEDAVAQTTSANRRSSRRKRR
jgi:hypothetical protein